MAGKVEKSAVRLGFCHFFVKKTGTHSVGKSGKRGNFVGLFCKTECENTICITAAKAKMISWKRQK